MKDIIKSIIKIYQDKKIPDIKMRNQKIPIDIPLIISLIGTRRSGKTYQLFAIKKELLERGVPAQNIVYINFEDERLNLQTSDLDYILQAYFELYPDVQPENCYFLFDEIQNINGWEKFVRRIFDTVSKKIFITGSNSKLLSSEIATSLRGRTLSFTIYPLSLNEYLQFFNVDIDLFNPQKKAKIVKYTEQFLFGGGFPEIVFLDKNIQTQVLQNYFNTMIYRDIIELYKVAAPLVLKYFIKKVFAGIGKPLSVNKIYNDLRSMNYKVSNNYLYDFEEYINSIFLTVSAPKFNYSEIKQEKADKKVYAIDTGLLSAVEFSISENKGKLLENMVFLEFLKAGVNVFYFKDKSECDFVTGKDNDYTPVQVSYTLNDLKTRDREFRGLTEACAFFNKKQATIITFDEKDELEINKLKICVVPVYDYFLNYQSKN